MIIEDEPLIAMDIEQMVESLGHTVTGIARTHKEAIALFESQNPGMVLADIQLADGSSGIDAVNDILSKVSVPVIFITAFPERLLTGERPEPTFLVTKPFNPDMVKALISQALFFESDSRAAASRLPGCEAAGMRPEAGGRRHGRPKSVAPAGTWRARTGCLQPGVGFPVAATEPFPLGLIHFSSWRVSADERHWKIYRFRSDRPAGRIGMGKRTDGGGLG
jgi:CheY-like chemotaxis protein